MCADMEWQEGEVVPLELKAILKSFFCWSLHQQTCSAFSGRTIKLLPLVMGDLH